MPISIDLLHETDFGKIELNYDSNQPDVPFRLTVTESELSTTLNLNLDQLEEFIFKAKRVAFFARYEEATAEEMMDYGEEEDDEEESYP